MEAVKYVFIRNGAGFGYAYLEGDKVPEKVIKKDLKVLLDNKVVRKV